jgi:uncharacterized protein YjiS (DUF1127 family)
MTAITFAPQKSAAPEKSASSPWRAVLAVLRRLHRAHQAHRVAAELSRFSDYQLADLGLTRGDIAAAARGDLRG